VLLQLAVGSSILELVTASLAPRSSRLRRFLGIRDAEVREVGEVIAEVVVVTARRLIRPPRLEVRSFRTRINPTLPPPILPPPIRRIGAVSERGLAEHAGERRDRPDGADPEHERPLDQITETAFEADLEVRHVVVDFDEPDAHLLTQLRDIRA